MAAPMTCMTQCFQRLAISRLYERSIILSSINGENLYKRHGKTLGQCPVRCFGQPAGQTHPHLLKVGEVTPGIKKSEFLRRRTKLMELARESFKGLKSKQDHILIFPSSARRFMSYDIPYVFRQNTEFLYLCGFQEPDSVLIIHNQQEMDGDDNHVSALFVPKKDPAKELWDGPRSGVDGAVFLTGIQKAYNMDDLDNYLHQYCKEHLNYVVWYNYLNPPHAELHSKILTEFLKQNGQKGIEGPNRLVQQLRLVKSSAEINLMRKSVDIASDAFIEVMKFCHPQVNESHLYAKMDYECRIRDAEMLAYPPVVAGGNRANTIHYINNNQLIENGDLVLMDAGCEYHGYTSDLTRTWPISGRFSMAQRSLYTAVLNVQEALISLCTPDYSLDEIYSQMLTFLGFQLLKLGIIPSNTDKTKLHQMVREFCPHHVGHYLGMDVHDTADMSRSRKLEPGMIITIEPGVYIPNTRTDVADEFRGMGIRIEDNVLITSSEPEVLSAKCPKHPDEIESVIAS